MAAKIFDNDAIIKYSVELYKEEETIHTKGLFLRRLGIKTTFYLLHVIRRSGI